MTDGLIGSSNGIDGLPGPHSGGEFPAPGPWVLSAMYPDRLVWSLYPETGVGKRTISEYVFEVAESSGNGYPPREQCVGTIVLDRIWPDDEEQRCSSPEFILHANGEEVLKLGDQQDRDLESWWSDVTAVLKEYSDGR